MHPEQTIIYSLVKYYVSPSVDLCPHPDIHKV